MMTRRVGWKLIKGYKWHPHLPAIRRFHPDFNFWARRMLDEEPFWYTRMVE